MRRTLLAVVLSCGGLPPAVQAQETGRPCLTSESAPAPNAPVVVPIHLRNNHVTFQVCRRDTALLFVLDTGAGSSILDLEKARALGVQLGAPIRVRGAGAGSVGGARVPADTVVLPGTGLNIPIPLAIDFSALRAASGNRMDGILGGDFITRYVLALDYRQGEMRLYDRESFKYEGKGTVVPITILNNFIRARGELVLDDGARIPGEFTVDVGSSLALSLAKPFVETNRLRERISPSIRRPGGRGVGGSPMADVGRIAAFDLGGAEVNKPVVYMFGDSAGVFSSAAQGDGNIGGEILRRFTVYFDYKGQRMILEPHDWTSEPFETDMSGMQLRAMGDTASLIVEHVVAASPAGEAGLQKDDIVVAVDGVPATKASLDEVRRRSRRLDERFTLTIRRAGSEMVIRFRTRRLL